MKCDVIVTYCWNRVGYNIIRSLYNHGLKIVVGDTSKRNICSMSKYSIDNFVYSDPFTNEPEFIRSLINAIDFYKPNVLIPTHDEGLIIAKHIDELPKNLIYAMDSYDIQYKLSDKLQSTKIAELVGVPIPNIINSTQIESYPVVVKTKFGNSAKGVFFPKNQIELKNILDKFSPEEILIEDFFSGRDYSVDCIHYKNFFYATTYRSLVTKTDGGGTTTQREIVSMPLLENFAKRILDHVDYSGVCGIDFKVNEETGKVAFIEVNARYTGGLATPIAAGFDIPFIHYSLVTTGNYNKKISPVIGVKTKWILGDIIALITKTIQRTLKKEELKQIMSFQFDAFDDYYKDDKIAIIGELLYYFLKLVKNKKLNP